MQGQTGWWAGRETKREGTAQSRPLYLAQWLLAMLLLHLPPQAAQLRLLLRCPRCQPRQLQRLRRQQQAWTPR